MAFPIENTANAFPAPRPSKDVAMVASVRAGWPTQLWVPHSIAFFAIEWGRQTGCDVGFPKSSSVTDSVLVGHYPAQVPSRLKRYYTARDLHFITCSCYRRQPLLGT